MSFLASDDTADWLRATLKKWIDSSARLSKRASSERIRQLNRGQALVYSAALGLIERAKRDGKPLNLQRLQILAENFVEKTKRDTRDELRGRKAAAHRVIKIVRWSLALFQPHSGAVLSTLTATESVR
jgi:hypothetical protein